MFDEEFEELQQKAALHFTIKNRVLKLIEELSELNEVLLTNDDFDHFEEELLDSLICTKILCLQLSIGFHPERKRLNCIRNLPAEINFHIKTLAKALYDFCADEKELGRLKDEVDYLSIFLVQIVFKNYISEDAGFIPFLIEQKKAQLKAALSEEHSF